MKTMKTKILCVAFGILLIMLAGVSAFADAAATAPDNTTISTWDGVVPTLNAKYAFSGGTGTEADPYQIGSAADLIQLAVNVCGLTPYRGVHFRMTVDIDCGNKDGWLPIGGNTLGNNSDANYVDASFCGVFDGDGHTVSNWKIYDPLWHSGFFGQTIGATIKNLGIESGSIYSKKSWVGGLIGLAVDTTLENCYTKADVTIDRKGGTATAGGLIGKAQGATVVTNCYVSGDVTVLTGSSAGGNVGGLIGVFGGGPSSEVKNCWSLGDIVGKNAHAGGLFGTVTGNSTAVNCFSLGNVSMDPETTSAYFGAAIGQIVSASGMILNSGILTSATPADRLVEFFVSGYYEPDCQITRYDTLTLPLQENSSFMKVEAAEDDTTASDTEAEETTTDSLVTTAPTETTDADAKDTEGGETTAIAETKPADEEKKSGCLSAVASGSVILLIAGVAVLSCVWFKRKESRSDC